MDTDPQSLLDQARCFECNLPPGLMSIAEAGLVRQIVEPTIDTGGLVKVIPPPTGLALQWINLTSTVLVTWNTPPVDITGTQVEYSFDNISFVKVLTVVAAPGISYNLLGYVPGNTAYVRLRAVKGSRQSAPCPVVSLPIPFLLGSLVSYWKFEEAGGSGVNRLDSVGTSNWQPGLGVFNQDLGIIDNSFRQPAVNGVSTSTNGVPLGINAGESFTVAGWFTCLSDPNGVAFFARWHDGNDNLRDYWVGGSAAFANPRLSVRKSDNSTVTVTAIGTINQDGVTSPWNFIACGFDVASHQIWIEFNGGARVTQACSDIRNTGVLNTIGGFFAQVGGLAGRWDEWGFWKKSLTQAEVAMLYNNGNGFQWPWTGSRGQQIATKWAAQVVTNGGAAPAAATQSALTTFADALIKAQVWFQKIIALNFFAPDNLIASLTPIYPRGSGNNPWTNTGPFVAGDLTVDGLKSDGNKYLQTGINPFPATGTQLLSLSVYVKELGALPDGAHMGSADNVTFINSIAVAGGRNALGSFFHCCYDTAGAGEVLGGDTGFLGFACGSRVALNDARIFHGNSTTPFAQTGPTNSNVITARTNTNLLWVFRLNCASSLLPTKARLSFVHFGLSLTSAQAQSLFNAVQALRVALGGGYV